MILEDIISLLREDIRGAHVVDDERIDDRILQDYIMLTRNQFIKNHLNEKHSFEQNTLQTEVLDMSGYDSALDTVGISIEEKILRSEPLPRLIESIRFGPAIYEISSPDYMSKTIQLVPFDRLRWVGNGVVNKRFMYGAFYDNRIYVKAKSPLHKPLGTILVKGVYADPTEVSTYVAGVSQYPVNDYMIKYMRNELFKTDFQILLGSKSDENNDASGKVEA